MRSGSVFLVKIFSKKWRVLWPKICLVLVQIPGRVSSYLYYLKVKTLLLFHLRKCLKKFVLTSFFFAWPTEKLMQSDSTCDSYCISFLKERGQICEAPKLVTSFNMEKLVGFTLKWVIMLGSSVSSLAAAIVAIMPACFFFSISKNLASVISVSLASSKCCFRVKLSCRYFLLILEEHNPEVRILPKWNL